MNRVSVFSSFLLVIFILSGCSKPDDCNVPKIEEKWPVVNTDSIFIDLNNSILEKKRKQIDALVEKTRRATNLNGTVLYAENGRIVYEKAMGYNDLRYKGKKKPLKTNDVFQISSDSKMFTAEAVLMLVQQGLIDLDADIRTYIPEWPYEGITTRHLLNHRSGLSRYETLADEKWRDKKIPLTNELMIDLYIKYKPSPYFKPDNGFHYCNVNYALAASIVERVTKKRFGDFVDENIFKPLAMDSSFVYMMNPDTVVPTYFPRGIQGHYIKKRTRFAENEYLNGVTGDKMVFTNVEDMLLFNNAIDYGLLLPDSTQKMMFDSGSTKRRKNVDNYGFGWRISGKHKGCVFHYGWWKGYRSMVLRDNVHNRLLVLLTNTDKGANSENFWKILCDIKTEIPKSSVNISYLETKNGCKFPNSGYRNR